MSRFFRKTRVLSKLVANVAYAKILKKRRPIFLGLYITNTCNLRCTYCFHNVEDRYDDKEFIIHCHYNQLSRIQRATLTTNSLRITLNKIESMAAISTQLQISAKIHNIIWSQLSKFTRCENLLLEPGNSDITSHVNFNLFHKTLKKIIST